MYIFQYTFLPLFFVMNNNTQYGTVRASYFEETLFLTVIKNMAQNYQDRDIYM